MNPICRIGPIEIGRGRLALIAGPCLAESLKLCLQVAGKVAEVCRELGIGYVFKASYDKANRSSLRGRRGPGLAKGLQWLAEVRRRYGVPILSDVHEAAQVAPAAKVLDALQIPAFLCRQTDLLLAAGRAGKPVNIKKGQFMAPADMAEAVAKVRSTGNRNVLLTERGTFFGYNRLVNDFRSIPQMRPLAPVVFDATHSVQEPGALRKASGALGQASGGQRQYAPLLAAAAMAAGADALFLETHPDPDKALSDAACQIPLDELRGVLEKCVAVFEVANDWEGSGEE
jgi:2-dehydro-3-deoxyphosphooctonate aldolase (KDO 8-P synthase)